MEERRWARERRTRGGTEAIVPVVVVVSVAVAELVLVVGVVVDVERAGGKRGQASITVDHFLRNFVTTARRRRQPTFMLSRTSTTASAVCARCRYPPPLYRALHVSAALAFKADVGLTPRKPPRAKAKPAKPAYSSSSPKRFGGFKGPPPQKNLKEPTPARCRAVLSSELRRWVRSPKTLDRLRVIGLEDDQSRRILSIFAEEEPRSADGWFPPGEDDIWQMQRMVDDASTDLQAAIDGILTRRFLRFH